MDRKVMLPEMRAASVFACLLTRVDWLGLLLVKKFLV